MTYSTYKGHKDRETLWSLNPDELYIVSGRPSGVYETNKQTNIRFALKDVIVRKLDKEVSVADSPAVAFADHINCFRKIEGMDYVDLETDKEIFFLGTREIYTTRFDSTERVSLKLFRDVDVRRSLSELYRRTRNLETQWASLDPDTRSSRLGRTEKDLSRLESVIATYNYIPWLTQDAIKGHLQTITNKIKDQHKLNKLCSAYS